MAYHYLATLLIVLILGEIYFAPSLMPLDFLTQLWIQKERTCSLDTVAVMLQDWTRSFLLPAAIVVWVAGILVYNRRWEELTRFLIVIAGGALLCELAKYWVIRPRPSALPFVLDGNSFPSGHAANGVLLLAGAYLAWRDASPRTKWLELIVGTLVAAAIVVIAWQRLYLGRHWMTDVIGGLLLGSAWIFFVKARWRKRVTRASCAALCLFFAMAFLLLWLFPTLRIRLPSPLTVRTQPIARVDFASGSGNDLKTDEWSDVWQELGSPIRTMTQRESSVYLRLPEKGDYMLALGIRPTVTPKASTCNRLEVLFNRRSLEVITLYEGWRDYNVVAGKDVVVSGLNELTFRAHGDKLMPPIVMYVEAVPYAAFVNKVGLQTLSLTAR